MQRFFIIGMMGILTIGSCLITGCSKQSAALEAALKYSGDNRTELEKVLKYYSQHQADSLKLKAATFLIENMPGHYSPDSSCIAEYKARIDSMKELPSEVRSVLFTLPNEHPELCQKIIKAEDIRHITADFLIRHIESVFRKMDSSPWLEEIDFEIFCEYLLPYRIENEIIELSENPTKEISKHIDYMLQNYDNTTHSPKAISEYLTSQNVLPVPYKCPDKQLNQYLRTGNNRNKISLLCLRRAGIPTAADFTPIHRAYDPCTYWWCAIDQRLITKKSFQIQNLRIGKIYRQTFSHQPIPSSHKKEAIPSFFRNPFQKDVTDVYLKTATITLQFPTPPPTHYAYLSVYNGTEWLPICYGEVMNKQCQFTKLGIDCIYLPVCYPHKDTVFLSEPFILRHQGKIEYLNPRQDSLQTLQIRRLRPYCHYDNYLNTYIKGTRLECATSGDFKDAEIVFKIEHPHFYEWDTVQIDPLKKKRFWRIIKQGYAALSELQFLDKQGQEIVGQFIGPDTTNTKALTDKNPNTYKPIFNGVAIDFGQPVSIATIRFSTNNDNDNIYPGNEYELFYYQKGKWVSIGRQTASDDLIVFDRIPANALCQLKDITLQRMGCIFTCKNGEVRFW
ncbi:MAG: hypothetical protein RSA53_10835 [Odoribacter sp.]